MPHRLNWRNPAAWTNLRPFEKAARVLILAGVIYVVIGWQYLGHVRPDRLRGLEVALWFVGGHVRVWGIIWILVGLSAILSTRWPYFSTRWGYTAMSALAAVWFLQYLTGWVILGLPAPIVASAACAWAIIAMFWLVVADAINPEPPPVKAAPPAAADPGG